MNYMDVPNIYSYTYTQHGNYHIYLNYHCFLIIYNLHINIEYYVHVYMRADGLCGCVTCDAEYPPRYDYLHMCLYMYIQICRCE